MRSGSQVGQSWLGKLYGRRSITELHNNKLRLVSRQTIRRSPSALVLTRQPPLDTSLPHYTDGSVSDDKAAAAAVIHIHSSIERLPDNTTGAKRREKALKIYLCTISFSRRFHQTS